MTDLKNVRCAVFDHGLFLELALRLGRDLGKVFYVNPLWEESFPKVYHAMVGEGFDEIERVPELWDVIDKVDFVVFPDTANGGLQEYLEKQGMPVWGGRRADQLELRKLAFRKLQASLGMEVPDYDVVTGLDALRDYCRDGKHDDRWIKISPQFRGHQETFHHTSYELSREVLDKLGLEFGPMQDLLRFLCEKTIKADLEGGLDTYTVDGQHPRVAVLGYEAKDKCYFASVMPYADIDERITAVHEPLWPILKDKHCRQFLSSETKITQEGKSFLLEPTIRLPSPAGEEQMELYGNISEIIYEGAKGKLVEPEITARYACEAMVQHNGNKDYPRALRVPDSIRKWVKLYNTVKLGDTLCIIPGSEVIGAVVGVGDTPQEALDHLKSVAEELSDQPVTVHVEALAKIITEIDKSEDEGIKFGDESMPTPAEAVTE